MSRLVRPVTHSSEISMATAVTSRSQEASLAEPGLIKALFVHMKWERLSLVNAPRCRDGPTSLECASAAGGQC